MIVRTFRIDGEPSIQLDKEPAVVVRQPDTRPCIFTHIPSSIFLIVAAFSPNLILALALLVRAEFSQMDVPTRTSYVMAVVTPAERTAAASVTAVPRSLAPSLSPALAGAMLAMPFSGLPLVLYGILKIAYDLALLRSFQHVKPPEEKALGGT